MSYGVTGWHPGEIAIQRKLGFEGPAVTHWQYIEDTMWEDWRYFYMLQAPFVFITTLDDDLRPWCSVLAGRNGSAGFMKSPDGKTLLADIRTWDGDPILETIAALNKTGRGDKYRLLMAGLGIDFPSRLRHKFAGSVRDAKKKGERDFVVDLAVNQSLGNCPKYINIRQLDAHADAKPWVEHQALHMSPSDKLPFEVINFIHSADTMFLATVYKAQPEDAAMFPSHAGANHRGGLPGFMRVRPSDKRTVVIPDYSGNRHVSSLGNIETTGLAGVTIISYETGDILYLTGVAENIVGDAALKIMPRQAALTTLMVTGYTLVRDALPLRERVGTLKPSAYSPPIKYLREENRETVFEPGDAPLARLKSIEFHSDDIVTFEFELAIKDTPLVLRPGQAVALDFTSLLGRPAYAHMAPFAPRSINDDRVRTWTVSTAHEGSEGTRRFRMTMRRKNGGVVTGALFAISHKLRAHRPALLEDTRELELDIRVVGTTGEFFLPPDGAVRVLWAAGGIGVTPFLSMLAALTARGPNAQADVVLALSTREPEVFLSLVRKALGPSPPPSVRVQLDIFTHEEVPALEDFRAAYGPGIAAAWHKGRIPESYWKDVAEDREAFVCGPEGFMNAVAQGIRDAGVPNEKVHKEGFLF